MMEEEKKETSVENAEEESDFADEVKIEEPVQEEPKEEEKPVEEQINLYAEKDETPSEEKEPETEEIAPKEENKPAVVTNKKGEPIYQYDNEDLAAIEMDRQEFHKKYKKFNIIKWIVTGVALLAIAAGWIIPSVISGINSNIVMYVSLGVTVVAIAVLGAYSVVFRKKIDKSMKEYFKSFYEHSDKFVYPSDMESLNGTVDDKLPQDMFIASNIYKDVVKVGSRAYMTFNYKGYKGHIADAAAQKKGERQLETLFVGKFLKFENITSKDELLVYLKGNKRALPPNTLQGRMLIEDSKNMVIYGSGKARSLLTKKVREALAKFDTNKTFIDMAITVNENGLFLAMGYEDDLMVLPLEKPFNPAPTTQFKNDLVKVLNLVDAFVMHHDDR